MLKHFFSLLIISFSFFYSFSQEKKSKELSLVIDNDLFVSLNKDRYYTNGFFLTYRYVSKKNNEEKRIIEWQLAHEVFTPYTAVVPHISLHDRPFAANLYGSFGIHRVYKNKLVKTSVQLGVLGPAAFGKELQGFIHGFLNFREATGWKHQINNAFGLNFSASYLKNIAVNPANNLDVTWVNDAKIGTIYTNISSGFYTRIGLKPLQSLANSIAFNTALNNQKTAYYRAAESFLYLKTMVRFSGYDATIQGSFLNLENDITKKIVPVQLQVEAGIKFTTKRFNFGYAVQYHTNKSKGLKFQNGNIFGIISVDYLFGTTK